MEFKPAYVGLNLNNLPMQFVIALLGFPLGFIEYHILKPQPLVSSFNMPEILLWFLVLLIFTGLLEELIFRGIMYRAAFKAVGAGFALFYVSFIFAALHITHLSFWDVIFVFLVALLFTRIFVWQKSIVGLTVAHGLTNTTLYIICPLVF
ncbi:MAG: CPBP family intramembrane metalloprotease [Firmicutes bacterium]|nr:CPBP family intramembrane metalloprotease [Bacillota bacterium]